MQLEKEITRAIRHIAASDTQSSPSIEEQACIASRVLNDVTEGSYHFENAESIVLKQGSKKRLAKRYTDRYSSENILCQCIKQVLDNDFRVRYPNRNKISRSLFDILSAVIQMTDYTIVKFDFKNYFNSISSDYAFKKIIESRISDRLMRQVISDYCNKTKFAFAGLPTSNAIAEIMASEFDKLIEQSFEKMGVIFYSRYIDDSVLILNRYVEDRAIRMKLDDILDAVFRDKETNAHYCCKTRFNRSKYSYISSRTITPNPVSFDFLGYEFWLKNSTPGKTKIQCGITQDKRLKYQKRLEKLIKLYTDHNSTDYQNIELLRHRVAAFSSREVYLSSKHQTSVWKVKGFISNYGELRFLLGTKRLHPETDLYLKNMVKDAFLQAGFLPGFVVDSDKIDSGYNLYHNMKKNKTLLLVDGIGYDYRALVNLCGQVGISNIEANGKKRTYSSLVRDYLIKVKVGF